MRRTRRSRRNDGTLCWEKMSLREALRYGEHFLERSGIADARTDAWLLLEYVTGMRQTEYLARQSEALPAEARERYRELLLSRGKHIPLQHLTGEQEFMGLSFRVDGHVLIPRQDTETLVEEALGCLRPGMRVLDLCTGSGCIAVSLAKLGPWEGQGRSVPGPAGDRAETPEPGQPGKTAGELEPGPAADRAGTSEPGQPGEAAGESGPVPAGELAAVEPGPPVDASDVSEEALAVARGNARRLGARVRFIRSDLFEAITDRYDMIVSNPPYIRTAVIGELDEEVRLHEPRLALDGHADGLFFYRRIVEESGARLKPGGRLLLEIGYDQAEAVCGLLRQAGFGEIRVVRDLAGHDRVVCARRV